MSMLSNEILAFTLGMGVGLMFVWTTCLTELKKLKRLLTLPDHCQQQINDDALPVQKFCEKNGLDQKVCDVDPREVLHSGAVSMVANVTSYGPNNLVHAYKGIEGKFDDDESVESVLTEEHIQNEDNISELAAEFEAELKLMEENIMDADFISRCTQSAILDLDETALPHLVCDKIIDEGLPRMSSLEQNESNSAAAQADLDVNSLPVSPTKLQHRLQLLVQERQKEQISQLEMQLAITKQKLQSKELELRGWKEHVRHIVQLSSISTGDDAIEMGGEDMDPRHTDMNMNKKSSISSIVDRTELKMTSNARIQNLEANVNPVHFYESDSNCSCISSCSAAVCKDMDALKMPYC